MDDDTLRRHIFLRAKKRSALQYASAVQLWGEAAGLAQEQPWPPSYASTCVFCSLFRSSATFGKYLSHIRSFFLYNHIQLR